MEGSQTIGKGMTSTLGNGGKESKKDRHMKLIQDLSKFLEQTNETTVQEVLVLRRNCRESLESCDEDLQKFCARIDVDSFLLDKSEDHLIKLLQELKQKITVREDTINRLQYDLDQTEVKKSSIISKELKSLVDKLIAIGHQLPDDIERLVENEAFEINKEVINNRMEHAKFVADLRISHVQLEYELIERWEATRRKWRQLRHSKALEKFQTEITSEEYNNPEDRQIYMSNFRKEQTQRREVINKILADFQQLHYSTITVEQISDLQQRFTTCNEKELAAVQSCYNGLTSLRSSADYFARERVEDLRKELHVYGALKVDPKLQTTAKGLEEALNDPSLAELWRLGGGLKPDFQALISEMTCDEIVYDRVVISMRDKLELIISSFNLKAILEEKGRLVQLDKIRGMITKMRNSPRSEIPPLLKSLIPEIDEVSKMEKIPKIFQDTIQTIIKEMEEEFIALEKRILQSATAAMSANNSLRGTQAFSGTAGGSKTATTSVLAGGNTSKPATGASKSVTINESNSLSKSRAGQSRMGKTGGSKGTSTLIGGSATTEIMNYVDPILLKQWHRKLAVLFFGSDLPMTYQTLCLEIFDQVMSQLECNRLVDEVVGQNSTDQVRVMDIRYGKMIDDVCAFLENQTNFLFTQTTNLTNFYFIVATQMEKHRADQKTIDNKSADELWDLREDYRFQFEDLESEYEQTCQKIREATKQDEINNFFQKVLDILDKIQEGYRSYHKKACFAADRYALYAINEYRQLLVLFSSHVFMHPRSNHHIMKQYHRIFDQIERLNATFFEENPEAAGVKRVSDDDLLQLSTVNYVEDEEYISPHGENEDDYESLQAFAGSFQLFKPFDDILTTFNTDSFFKYTPPGANPEEVKEDEEDKDDKPLLTVGFTPHAQFPYLKEETTVFPKSNDEVDVMLPEDREVYEKTLAKYFLPIPEETINVKLPTPEEQKQYEDLKGYVDLIKQRQTEENSWEYLRQHIPTDQSKNQNWILSIEITSDELSNLFEAIRDSVISNVEAESMKKILTVEHDMTNKKEELTNELEDRIRNHWPRRGRVETEIKQPRETELLSHKDKTYRIILNIQSKMMEIQSRFLSLLDDGQKSCDIYIKEIVALRNLVRNDYKNLAALQGIDVKARGVTLDFQASNVEKIQILQKVLNNDITAVISNAKDFRKICPVQQPGVEGGYSEAELGEIEVLITQQIAEIEDIVTSDWQTKINSLQEQQMQSLKTYDEFTAKYAQCVQEVAMAEGLGQKYGAPRRRAQERIRTEIGLDEKKSGKVDEFIAQIEFISSEINVGGDGDALVLFEQSTVSGANPLPPPPLEGTAKKVSFQPEATLGMGNAGSSGNVSLISQGIDQIKNIQLLWQLCKVLKDLLNKRVSFLNVIGELGFPVVVELLPWINDQRFYELNDLAPSSSTGGALVVPGKNEVVIHHDRFLEEIKEILNNVVKNSIIAEAIPTSNNNNNSANSPPKISPRTGKAGTAAPVTNTNTGGGAGVVHTLEIAFEDINQNCRKETKQLYESEGLLSALTSKNGVPESLEVWLSESHHKIFGRYGYREKAWKRLWAQIERLDLLLIRNRNLSSDTPHQHQASSRPSSPDRHPETSSEHGSPTNRHNSTNKKKTIGSPTRSHQTHNSAVSVPPTVKEPKPTSIQSAVFFYYTKSMICFSQYDYQQKYHELEALLRIWEQSKQKNERLLRPKLASPDRAEELSQLDQLELQRSNELTTVTIQFRNFMIRKQIVRFRAFIDDIISLAKGLILFIDSVLRIELIALPPDTEVPKKHMTLKKLRKAQRIRDEVAKGGADKSKKRQWPAIEIQEICDLIKQNEDLLTDLGKDPSDFTGGTNPSTTPNEVADAGAKGKGGKSAPPAKKGSEKNQPASALNAATANPSLVPQVWIEKMKEISLVEGLVSSAQRVVIEERILAIQRYAEFLKHFFSFMRDEFNRILKQEESWNERWKRQVEMLRSGNGSNNQEN